MVFLSVGAHAAPWILTVSGVVTASDKNTRITGTSEEGAFISAKDSNGVTLACNPFFLGVVLADGKYQCTGKDLKAPITVTAGDSFFTFRDERDTNTARVLSLNSQTETWPLTVDSVYSIAGLWFELKGESKAGSMISAVDSKGDSLLCGDLFGIQFTDGYTCSGLFLTLPITVSVTENPLLPSFYKDNTKVVYKVTE